METNVNYTVVGAFVIALFSLLVFSMIWLSSGFSSAEYTPYRLYMKESVAGLNIDSAVEFNGVNVGTVKKIELDVHDPRLVLVLLNVKNTTPITQGTRATLNTKGLTGMAYVALEDKGDDLKPVQLQPDEPYLIIKTSPSLFFRLDTGMRKLNDNLAKFSKAVEALLDEENLTSIREILIDVRHVTRTLATHTNQISTILKNTAQASGQFIPVMQNSQNIMRLMSTQILPQANAALLNLNQLSNNLSAVSREIKENPAIIIRGKTQQILGPGE